MEAATIKVGGMSCGGCVKNVTGALLAVDGVAGADVSLEKGEAVVKYDGTKVGIPDLQQAIEDAGFDVG